MKLNYEQIKEILEKRIELARYMKNSHMEDMIRASKSLQIDNAYKYQKWVHEDSAVLIELEYIYDKIIKGEK